MCVSSVVQHTGGSFGLFCLSACGNFLLYCAMSPRTAVNAGGASTRVKCLCWFYLCLWPVHVAIHALHCLCCMPCVFVQVRAHVEQAISLIADGKAEHGAVVAHTLEQFRAKFLFFVSHITRMDALFEASFSPLASSGEQLETICGAVVS